MTDKLNEAVELLKRAEWAHQIWEEDACPWCYGFKEVTLPKTDEYKMEPPGHKSDCVYKIFMDSLE